jgi:hypothetical protein
MTRKRKPWGYESRGIPFSVGCLPAILLWAVVVAIPFVAPDLIEQCVGQPVEPPRGKAGILYAAFELACSPLLLFGSYAEIALFLFLLCVVAGLVWARFWIRKHEAYWDVIRAKEKERRQQKRLEREQKKREEGTRSGGRSLGGHGRDEQGL